MTDYRLFVDEAGDHTRCDDPTATVGKRFLGLVGLAMPRGARYEAFQAALEAFKQTSRQSCIVKTS